LVEFVFIWYIFPVLVCLDQEKSGNPGPVGTGFDSTESRASLETGGWR
jgi:hypothetical protein